MAQMPRRADRNSTTVQASFGWRWLMPMAILVILAGLTTFFLWRAQTRLEKDHLIFIYLVPTALVALRYGNVSAMGVAIGITCAAGYVFYPERYSFVFTNPLDLVELALFALLALLASQVVAGFANDREVIPRRRRSGVLRRRERPALTAPRTRIRSARV